MRLPLALILTIFTIICPVLSANDLKPFRIRPLRPLRRADGPSGSSTSNSSVLSTPTSSTSTSTSRFTSSTFTPSTPTSTSTSSPSSQSPFSTFTTSSSSTSTQQSSLSLTSSSRSTQIFSSTSSLATSDSPSTAASQTTFTSTGSDGSLLTVTAVISRPSGGSGSGSISTAKQGFFANTGAVAGTFLVVGLVGTGILICVFLWALRRYRRHNNNQVYLDDEFREIDQHGDSGTTAEATLPVMAQESALEAPVPSSPTPNMIERLHGNEATAPNVYFDSAQYQTQPGEFNPYQDHSGLYAYLDDQADYGQYPGSSQQGTVYQPGTKFNGTTGQYQPIAGLPHAPQGAMDSLHQVNSDHQDAETH